MIDIQIRAKLGLEITYEFPSCSFLIKMKPIGEGDNSEFQLFTSLEHWFQLRKTMPKSADYVMISQPTEADSYQHLRDRPAADAWAEEFYAREVAKLIPTLPPEAPGTDDIVDEAAAEKHADDLIF